MTDKVVTAHGLEFTITLDEERAYGPGNGEDACFTPDEIRILEKLATEGGKLPMSFSRAVHAVKFILGGEVVTIRTPRRSVLESIRK